MQMQPSRFPNNLPGNLPAISLSNVALTLSSAAGPVNILHGVSLTVSAGETVALTGPSGSGKSSLLMVAAGLERPSAGRIVVAGTDITGMGEDAAARFRRGRVGIVFQSFHLIPTMTALENVAVPLELMGVDNAWDRAAQELKAVGLAERGEHYPGQLSGGEQQRVALARAMAPRPQICSPTNPPVIWTARMARLSPIFFSRSMPSAAPRCFWSPMKKAWPGVAVELCGWKAAIS